MPQKPDENQIFGAVSLGRSAKASGADAGAQTPATEAGAVEPVPGELSPWAKVAEFVGLVIPETFAPPTLPADNRVHPGLTRYKPGQVKTGGAPEAPKYSIEPGLDCWFLNALPATFVHSLHPTAERGRSLSRSSAAWPSAVGETGTAVRISENEVLTAFHVWEKFLVDPRERSSIRCRVFVVFDYVDAAIGPTTVRRPGTKDPPDYNGWGRQVQQVALVVGEVARGPEDPAGPEEPLEYPPERDWVVLRIRAPTGVDLEPWPAPFELDLMRFTDWQSGRRRKPPGGEQIRGTQGQEAKKDKFELDRLVMISHPLGTAKMIVEGGNVLRGNGKLFQHDLDSFSGNSGGPIFRPALGEQAELWLVGINLSGHDLVRKENYMVPASCEDGHYAAHENLAFDIRTFLDQRSRPNPTTEKTGPRQSSTSNAAISNRAKSKRLFYADLTARDESLALEPGGDWKADTQESDAQWAVESATSGYVAVRAWEFQAGKASLLEKSPEFAGVFVGKHAGPTAEFFIAEATKSAARRIGAIGYGGFHFLRAAFEMKEGNVIPANEKALAFPEAVEGGERLVLAAIESQWEAKVEFAMLTANVAAFSKVTASEVDLPEKESTEKLWHIASTDVPMAAIVTGTQANQYKVAAVGRETRIDGEEVGAHVVCVVITPKGQGAFLAKTTFGTSIGANRLTQKGLLIVAIDRTTVADQVGFTSFDEGKSTISVEYPGVNKSVHGSDLKGGVLASLRHQYAEQPGSGKITIAITLAYKIRDLQQPDTPNDASTSFAIELEIK